MRIAYVEDNPTNLALVERVASMNKHVIVSYTEGEIAQKELMREKFDLILMDVELAGEIGGLQVVRSLRAQGLTTPIIAVTAYAMLGDRDRCIEAGCDDYLPKPLPIPQLLATLNRYDELVKNPVPAGAAVGAAAAAGVTSAPPVAPTPPPAPVPSANPTVAPSVTTVSSAPPAPVVPVTPGISAAAISQPQPTPAPAPENKEGAKEISEAAKAPTDSPAVSEGQNKVTPPPLPPAPQNPNKP
ncbi:MAG TPA: response regulator [Aggregatilineales bacterium]|nr:response regulator [Aggregatilineales bacterium]